MPTGYTSVSASNLKDASGNLVTNATISFTPVDNAGKCISFRSGGAEGQTISQPVTAVVSNGAFLISLADTSLTDPINVGYWVRVWDNLTGENLLGPGYGCVQPTGSSWSFDTYAPNVSPLALVQAGPTGPQGPQGTTGATGPAGTVTATGVNGGFTVPGYLTIDDGINAPRNIIGTSGTQSGWGTRLTNGQYSNLALTTTSYGPGYNLGNFGGWSGAFGEVNTLIARTRGIDQALKVDMRKQAHGDAAGGYFYVYGDGGLSDPSAEGITGFNAESGEYSGYFHGHITATTGTGDTQPVLAFDSGNAWLTDGNQLLNMATGGIGGNITGVSSQLAGAQTNIMKLPTNQSVIPLTTAWGTVGVIANADNTSDMAVSVTMTATLNQIGGVVKPFVVGFAYLAGQNFPEWIKITSIGAVSGTSQVITFLCRYPQPNGATIFQGGVMGQRLSFDQSMSFGVGMRTTYNVFGCFDGVNLIVGSYAFGGLSNRVLPRLGLEPATATGGFHTYLGAEIIVNRQATGLLITLEQNPIGWAVGQNVECPHYSYVGGHGLWIVKQQYTGADATSGSPLAEFTMLGDGINSATTGLLVDNQSPNSNFTSAGGPMVAPDLLYGRGAWTNLLLSFYGPGPGGSCIRWFENAGGVADSAAPDVAAIQPPNSNAITWSPSTGLWKITSLQVGALTIPDGGSIKALGGGATSHFQSLIVDSKLDMSMGAPSVIKMKDSGNGQLYNITLVNGVLTATVSS